MKKYFLIILVLFFVFVITVQGQASPLPAFPRAEGYGALAKGGRGGRVIEVTNLNDSGPGSLRTAVNATGPRIVVFRVGGSIELQSDIIIRGEDQAYLTVAGQTAPGGGILLKNYGLWIMDTHDVVVRYLRIRIGYQGAAGGPHGILIYGYQGVAYNVIIDHVSVSWILDDNAVYGNVHDVTIQWGLFGEAAAKGRDGQYDCSNTTNNQGGCGFMWGPADKVDRLSFHHNLLIHNYYRNPGFGGGEHQIANNVIYNYGWSATIVGQYGATYPIVVDFSGNYYKMGPDSRPGIKEIYSEETHDPTLISLFLRDNYGWNYNPEDPHAIVGISGYEKRQAPLTPGPQIPVIVDSHERGRDLVLQNTGATLPARDSVDTRLINDFKAGTSSPPSTRGIDPVFPNIANGTPPTDSDGDGMPDAWELERGLNPYDPSDGPQDRDGDGYTNIEEYLNELAGDTEPDYAGCTLYVSTSGSDGNDGKSESTPFQAIQKAADMVVPGDVVCVKGGDYAKFSISRSGTAAQPITFRAHGDGTPRIYAPADGQTYGLVLIRSSHNVIDGFSIVGGLVGLQFNDAGAAYNKVLNCDISLASGTGIGFYFGAHDNLVRGCRIHDNAQGNFNPRGRASSWGAGVGMHYGCVNNVFEDNAIYWNHGEGLTLAGDHSVARRNIIADNWGVNLYVVGPQQGTLIEDNIVYLSPEAKSWPDCAAKCWNNNAENIAASIELAQPGDRIAGLTIRDNILVNGGTGIRLFQNDANFGATGWTIVNNHLIRNDSGLHSGMMLESSTLANNVILQNTGGKAVWFDYPSPGNAFTHNVYFGTQANAFQWGSSVMDFSGWGNLSGETGSQWSDPWLVNASAIPPRLWSDPPPNPSPSRLKMAEPYKLSSISPAIDAGTSQNAPSTDFEGTSRPQGTSYDVGAYEYAQDGDTASPTVPTGLTAVAVSSTQINLSWSASTDNVAVTGYRIYRDGNQIATTAGTSYQDTGRFPSTTYTYRVAAYDAAGNVSAQSSQASATTPAAPDTQAPTAPKGLKATVISSTQINLSWTASTDNVGVTGYKIYQNSTQIRTTAGTSYQATGLNANTSYAYRVAAYDAAGNTSAKSLGVTAKTQPSPSTMFTMGDRVQTTWNVTVRSTPSNSGTASGTQLKGAMGRVAGGPFYSNLQWWWQIDFDSGVDGWVAQGRLKRVAP